MRFHKLVIRNIVSPYGMTLISLALPPCVSYSALPLFQLHTRARFCVSGSCISRFLSHVHPRFLLGLMFVDFVFPLHSFTYERRKTRFSPMWFFLLPLVAGTALMVLSIVLLLRNNTYLLELLSTAEGEQIKSVGGIELDGTLVQAFPVLLGIVLWAIWRKDQFNIQGWRRSAVHSAIFVATLAMLVSSTLKLARGDLMPIIAGLGILFVLRRFINGKLTLASIVKSASILAGSIVALFISFSVLRGVADLDTLIGSILGYTIAAYNRMAAILDGRLHYPFSGRGLYISAFVAFNNSLTACST